MEKCICLCLALLLVLGGAALAENVIGGADGPTSIYLAPTVVTPEDGRYVLIARAETDGTYSYALVGAGTGEEAMALFGGAGASEERIAAFTRFAAALEPAVTLESGADPLVISRSEDGGISFSAGALELVRVEDGTVFAIVTGSFAQQEISVEEGCAAYIWDEDGVLEYGVGSTVGETINVCPHCGRPDDGTSRHHTVISEYCKEGHTLCMGDPEHYCDPDEGGCGDYYPCSRSNSHTPCAKCGKLWCYKEHGDHKELACGHRGCEVYGEEEAHAQCAACGGYLCDGQDHTLAACGKHHMSETGDHSAAPCGQEGHFNCDGQDHGAAACQTLGHFACDDQDHTAAPCGEHFACEEGYDAAQHAQCPGCGVYVCSEGYVAEEHAQCETCGGYLCDGKDHNHAPSGETGSGETL